MKKKEQKTWEQYIKEVHQENMVYINKFEKGLYEYIALPWWKRLFIKAPKISFKSIRDVSQRDYISWRVKKKV